ncbi:gamma-glutamylcyclotransferase-like [Maniola hyperantus]|uniref:gamma-glutamylcyclotransferase-like n=1 Tax=Aphantopus hyperantus TaxID=2795564 RepID=UPI00156A3059|nr:gamma-glutamylcyclotransferase-like [Maniola hyperantus]
MLRHEIYKPDTFLYYSYGSNMFSFRIHMNNPSAEFVSIARLDNYRLDFITYSKFWGGPTATLVPTANAHVWGVIWRLDIKNIAKLDEQEGVDRKIYYPKHVEVLTPYMGTYKCRVYVNKVNPLPRCDNDDIPAERWPSWTYKEIIILGAMEHQLPQYYIQALEKIKQNGDKGCFKMYTLLLKFVNEEPCVCDISKKKEKPQIWIS